MEGVRPQDPLERRHEHLADGEDRGHEGVGLSRVEQEQDDACPDDDLDEPEDEDDDAAGELGPAGACPGGAAAVRLHRLPATGRCGFLGDDRLVDLVDGHAFSSACGIRGSGVWRPPPGDAPANAVDAVRTAGHALS